MHNRLFNESVYASGYFFMCLVIIEQQYIKIKEKKRNRQMTMIDQI